MADNNDTTKQTVNIVPDGKALDAMFMKDFEHYMRKLKDLREPFSLHLMHSLLSRFNIVWGCNQRSEQEMRHIFDHIMKTLVRRTDFEAARGEDGYLWALGDEFEFNCGEPGAEYVGVVGTVQHRYTDENGRRYYFLRSTDKSDTTRYHREEVELYLDLCGPEED